MKKQGLIFSWIGILAYVASSIFFLYTMYTIKFSYPELAVFAVFVLIILITLFNIAVGSEARSTRTLGAILFLLVAILLVLASTLLIPWIKEFFVLS